MTQEQIKAGIMFEKVYHESDDEFFDYLFDNFVVIPKTKKTLEYTKDDMINFTLYQMHIGISPNEKDLETWKNNNIKK